MNRMKWSIFLGLGLLSSSMLIYTLHYLVFGELKLLLMSGFASLAFVPIQGMVVVMIIAELLVVMVRRTRMQKMNMVIGAFFSELGTRLLHHFYVGDPNGHRLREVFEKAGDLSGKQVQTILQQVGDYQYISDLGTDDLIELRKLLVAERGFMVRLLENPNLLENERFTELLWAVFHLTEELDARDDLNKSPKSDLEHLKGDVTRAYRCLFVEWVHYMRHLHDNYPFLFSFAMRTNPLEQEKQVEVL